jgi:protein SCO1/2
MQRTQRIVGVHESVRVVASAIVLSAVATFAPFASVTVFAQKMTGSPATAGYRQEPGQTSSTMPPALREIGFDQKLDQRVPLDLPFRDETGRAVRLSEFFGARPVVLVFAYYECPMLCAQVVNGLGSALGVISLMPGEDFEVVVVSFDPKDTPASAAAKKALYLDRYKREGAAGGSHFLVGNQPEIARLTQAAGFRYVWDEPTQQFAHPSGVIVLTPDGRLARYMFGIEYGPRDLRFAIVEASNGRAGNPADALLLYCFHYDPMTGRYGFVIMRALRLAGIGTVLALGAFIILMIRREKQRQAPAAAPGTQHPARSTR